MDANDKPLAVTQGEPERTCQWCLKNQPSLIEGKYRHEFLGGSLLYICENPPAQPSPVVQTPDFLVTVCDKCLQATCWQGLFYCDDYKTAGTVDLPVSKLREMGRENPCYWKDTGLVAPVVPVEETMLDNGGKGWLVSMGLPNPVIHYFADDGGISADKGELLSDLLELYHAAAEDADELALPATEKEN